ncbi:FAD-dependent monooxygenase, partial [Candidatus Bipolaricaulota bacterium]|nr:FAD-dependent monooxygenase [Candidatus Bipolaricaulota bacterium]
MDKRPDLLVVGGGPAGAITARAAAERGVDTLLVDKKKDLSTSSTCGGLVSMETWRRLGSPESAFVGEIRGAIIHLPDGTSYKLAARNPRAIVLDRGRLNEVLLGRAMDKGVRVEAGLNLVDLDKKTARLKNLATGELSLMEPRYVVGADGPVSDVRRLVGGGDQPRRLYAVQVDARSGRFHGDLVEVYFGRDVAPGFFAW